MTFRIARRRRIIALAGALALALIALRPDSAAADQVISCDASSTCVVAAPPNSNQTLIGANGSTIVLAAAAASTTIAVANNGSTVVSAVGAGATTASIGLNGATIVSAIPAGSIVVHVALNGGTIVTAGGLGCGATPGTVGFVYTPGGPPSVCFNP